MPPLIVLVSVADRVGRPSESPPTVAARVRRLLAARPTARLVLATTAAADRLSLAELSPAYRRRAAVVVLSDDRGGGGLVAAALDGLRRPSGVVLASVDSRVSTAVAGRAASATRPAFWLADGRNAAPGGNPRLAVDPAAGRVVRVGYTLPVGWSGVVTLDAAAARLYARLSPGRERWTLAERLDHLLDHGLVAAAEAAAALGAPE